MRQRQHVSRIHSVAVLPEAPRTFTLWSLHLPSTSFRRLFSRVVCSSNMGKRSRQRQKNQTAGRDDRDNAVRPTLLLRQLLLVFGGKCPVRPHATFLFTEVEGSGCISYKSSFTERVQSRCCENAEQLQHQRASLLAAVHCFQKPCVTTIFKFYPQCFFYFLGRGCACSPDLAHKCANFMWPWVRRHWSSHCEGRKRAELRGREQLKNVIE